jgi:hypothetical protein
MTTRDGLKGPEHFETVIKNLRDETTPPKGTLSPVIALPQIISAMYSAGYPVEDIRPTFGEYLRVASIMPAPMDVVYLLSFALLLGVDDSGRKKLAAIAARDTWKEPFQGFLEDSLGLAHPPIPATRKGTLWKFYRGVREASNSAGRTEFLAGYLRRGWYNSWRGEPWWGNHTHGGVKYFGYWAWEVAATAKVYGLDDTALCASRYYPADMAHFLDRD